MPSVTLSSRPALRPLLLGRLGVAPCLSSCLALGFTRSPWRSLLWKLILPTDSRHHPPHVVPKWAPVSPSGLSAGSCGTPTVGPCLEMVWSPSLPCPMGCDFLNQLLALALDQTLRTFLFILENKKRFRKLPRYHHQSYRKGLEMTGQPCPRPDADPGQAAVSGGLLGEGTGTAGQSPESMEGGQYREGSAPEPCL